MVQSSPGVTPKPRFGPILDSICMTQVEFSMAHHTAWGIRGTRNNIRVFYSDLAFLVNTATLNMYIFMSYTG